MQLCITILKVRRLRHGKVTNWPRVTQPATAKPRLKLGSLADFLELLLQRALRVAARLTLGVGLAQIWDSEILLNGQVEAGKHPLTAAEWTLMSPFLPFVHPANVTTSQMEGWHTGLGQHRKVRLQ